MRSASTVLLRTQSDARLAALARAGHDRAFEAIVERYRRPLLRASRRILPEARAEDALQQALMAAWTALRRGDEVHELRPWLYRVVRNTALNQLRVAGYDLDELVDTLAASEDPEEEVERRLLVRQTLTAVAALPERQRDALLRTTIEGRGQDEVARDLGLTDSALRQLVHRARVSVRTAATALVPWPLAAWLAAAGTRGEPRIAELVTSAAAAGGSAWAAKAGAVAVIAGSTVTAPAVIDPPEERDGRAAEANEPAEVAATEAAGEPPAPALLEQPAGEAHAERAGDSPETEGIAAAGRTNRATRAGPEPEPHMVEREPDVQHPAGGDIPPPTAPVDQPAPPAPVAPPPTPVPTPTATAAPAVEAEDPVADEAPAEEQPDEDPPAEPGEPEDPPGGENEAGVDDAAPSAP
jgi:RNA polymerase sigma factor (sigma-70 family)